MHPPLATSISSVVLVLIAVASVVVLALIIVAPWKRVREEPPLDKDVETRLLLHRPNPEDPTGELPITGVVDLDRHGEAGDTQAGDGPADFAELRELDDP